MVAPEITCQILQVSVDQNSWVYFTLPRSRWGFETKLALAPTTIYRVPLKFTGSLNFDIIQGFTSSYPPLFNQNISPLLLAVSLPGGSPTFWRKTPTYHMLCMLARIWVGGKPILAWGSYFILASLSDLWSIEADYAGLGMMALRSELIGLSFCQYDKKHKKSRAITCSG